MDKGEFETRFNARQLENRGSQNRNRGSRSDDGSRVDVAIPRLFYDGLFHRAMPPLMDGRLFRYRASHPFSIQAPNPRESKTLPIV